MAEIKKTEETRPYLMGLHQITSSEECSEVPKKIISEAAKMFEMYKVNCVLPIVCATDDPDKFQLLSGLSIYEAAKSVGLKQIWVFMIATSKEKIGEILVQLSMFSKLNEIICDSKDMADFLAFLNDKKSDLTLIRGIGKIKAATIEKHRPYKSVEDLYEIKGFGAKTTGSWLQAFKLRSI